MSLGCFDDDRVGARAETAQRVRLRLSLERGSIRVDGSLQVRSAVAEVGAEAEQPRARVSHLSPA